ncbi:MAG: class F sortase [Pseudonocardiales bacterium]|nr:class F sortase [Actinomycetota bacterium]
MSTRGRHRRPRRSGPIAATAAAVLTLIAISGYYRLRAADTRNATGTPITHSAQPNSGAPSTSPTISGVNPTRLTQPPRTTTTPTHVTIASIGVSSALEPLHLLADMTLKAPSQWAVAGWYSGGVVPGQIGPAVIAGHVDSTRGPAVFYRLRDVTVGATVSITDRNGAVSTFVVDQVRNYPKDKFPTAAVYGPTPIPVLRLITCAGEFDRATGNYVDNLVVSAHLV